MCGNKCATISGNLWRMELTCARERKCVATVAQLVSSVNGSSNILGHKLSNMWLVWKHFHAFS